MRRLVMAGLSMILACSHNPERRAVQETVAGTILAIAGGAGVVSNGIALGAFADTQGVPLGGFGAGLAISAVMTIVGGALLSSGSDAFDEADKWTPAREREAIERTALVPQGEISLREASDGVYVVSDTIGAGLALGDRVLTLDKHAIASMRDVWGVRSRVMDVGPARPCEMTTVSPDGAQTRVTLNRTHLSAFKQAATRHEIAPVKTSTAPIRRAL